MTFSNKLEVEAWVSSTRPGDVVVYHVGHLAADRVQSPAVDVVAFEIWRAAQAEVSLTQRRLGPGRYEYRATKSNGAITPLNGKKEPSERSERSAGRNGGQR